MTSTGAAETLAALAAAAPAVAPVAELLASSGLVSELTPNGRTFRARLQPDTGPRIAALLAAHQIRVDDGERLWARIDPPGVPSIEIRASDLTVRTAGYAIAAVLENWDTRLAAEGATEMLSGLRSTRTLTVVLDCRSLAELAAAAAQAKEQIVLRHLAARLTDDAVDVANDGPFGTLPTPARAEHAEFAAFLSDSVNMPYVPMGRLGQSLASVCLAALERPDLMQAARDLHLLHEREARHMTLRARTGQSHTPRPGPA